MAVCRCFVPVGRDFVLPKTHKKHIFMLKEWDKLKHVYYILEDKMKDGFNIFMRNMNTTAP